MHIKFILIQAGDAIDPRQLPPSFPEQYLPLTTEGILEAIEVREKLHKDGLGAGPTMGFYASSSRSQVTLALIVAGKNIKMSNIDTLSIPEAIKLSRGRSLGKYLGNSEAQRVGRELHLRVKAALRDNLGRGKENYTAVVVGHDVMLNFLAMKHCPRGDHRHLRELQLQGGEYIEAVKIDDGDEYVRCYPKTGERCGSVYRRETGLTEHFESPKAA